MVETRRVILGLTLGIFVFASGACGSSGDSSEAVATDGSSGSAGSAAGGTGAAAGVGGSGAGGSAGSGGGEPVEWQAPNRALVASYYPKAASIGRGVLESGGSAADAYIATAMAEWVLTPGVTSFAGNFGALTYDPSTGKVAHLDGEYFNVADPDGGFVEGQPLGKTVVVFGSIAALSTLHERHGKLSWAELLGPAIELARDGIEVDATYSAIIDMRLEILSRSEYGRQTYLPSGFALPAGSVLKLPEVASFLTAVAEQGADYMYEGDWAESCVAAVRAQGGLLTAADLANYEARWHEPLQTDYRGHDVFASAGRYYGGVFSLLGLEIIEHGTLDTSSHYSRVGVDLATLVLTARVAWNQPWLTNNAVLDDRGALAEALSPEQTLPLWQSIQASRPTQATVRPVPTHSTSLAVVDADGFVIVGTHSINALPWGEGIFVQGVALTGGGRWFNTAGPGEARGTPLSHHMVMRDGHLMFASSSWDSSLVEAEFQYLINAIDYGLPADEAASVPRFGYFPWSYTTFETDMDSNWLDARVSAQVVAEAASTGLNFTQDGYVDTGRGTLVSFAPDGTTIGANASRGSESPPGAVEYVTNAP